MTRAAPVHALTPPIAAEGRPATRAGRWNLWFLVVFW